MFALKSCAAYALIFWTPLVISDLLGPSGRPLHAILLTSVPYAFAAAAAMGVGWLSHKYVSLLWSYCAVTTCACEVRR